MLRFHGSRDKQTFELVGTNSRLDAIQAAALRVFLPHLAGWNDGRREGAARYAELGLGEAVELPVDEPGHVYHMYVVRTPDRARIAAALKEAGIASASYYVTPLHLQPAMRYLGYGPGSLPETERAAAENLALPMWGGIGADVQEQVVADRARVAARPRAGTGDSVLAALPRPRSPAVVRSPFNRHALWQIAADAAIIALAWTLAWLLRFDQGRPVYYDRYLDWQIILVVVAIQLTVFALAGFYNRWWRYVSTRDMWAALRGVALASLATFLVFTLFEFHPARVPTGVWFIDLLLCLAFVAGSRLLARTLIERPLPGPGRRPRQGGDRRRRRRRGAARDQGDAAQPGARLHADRDRRRRPAQAEPPPPRHPRPRHHRRPAAADPRPPAGRGADRDAVRLGRGARQDRRGRPRGRAAGQDAAGPDRARQRRLRPRRRQLRPVEVEDVLGREPVEVDLDGDRRLRLRRGRDGHRRRRLDRLRALPPARAARPGAARARRPLRAGAVRDRPRARPRARLPRRRAGRRRRQGRRQDAPGVRQVPARASSSTRPRTSTSR